MPEQQDSLPTQKPTVFEEMKQRLKACQEELNQDPTPVEPPDPETLKQLYDKPDH